MSEDSKKEIRTVVDADFAVNMAIHYLDSLEYGNSKDDIQVWIMDDVQQNSFDAVEVSND